MGPHVVRAVAAASLLTIAAPPAAAQWTWTDRAELSFVSAAGNSSATTLGVKNALTAAGGLSKLALEFGGIRTESSTHTRVASGTRDDFTVTETTTSEVTAEKYFARTRYDRTVAGTAYVFGGAGWDRNTFAGIQGRYNFVSGVGNQWVEREDVTLRTDIGLTYTVQDNVAEGPDQRFGGLRITWELLKRVTDNTDFESSMAVDENLQDTGDWRADMITSVAVAMSERLALKTSLQLLFDHAPSFVDVPLQGTDTHVPVQLGQVDSVFTVALVINVR